MNNWLGVDFGTSNSAAAYISDNQVMRVPLEPGHHTIPTSVFFDFEDQCIKYGREADAGLLNGFEGRYMRSLKSVLGTSLMGEKRMLIGQRLDFYDIITGFIVQLKKRSEKQAGMVFEKVVAGRPVFFHRSDALKEKCAENDLERCFRNAGFSEVKFVYEPEAAAFASAQSTPTSGFALVLDIGGGTSDFTLFKQENGRVRIICSNGLRIGGTDFDRQISLDHFMPLLGRGHFLKRIMGTGVIQAPLHIYGDLSTWEKIPFLYERKPIRLAKDMVRDAVEPHVFSRLVKVLEMQLGHDLAFITERTKISANQSSEPSVVNLGQIERGLNTSLSAAEFDNSLSKFKEQISAAILETVENGKVGTDEIKTVISVGGSSSMRLVVDAAKSCLPGAEIRQGAVFTSIVDGLAIASRHEHAASQQNERLS